MRCSAGGISSIWVLITSGSSLSITEGLKRKDKGSWEVKHKSDPAHKGSWQAWNVYIISPPLTFLESLYSAPLILSLSAPKRWLTEWGWGKGEHWGLIPAVMGVRPLHVPRLPRFCGALSSTGLQCTLTSHKRVLFLNAGIYSVCPIRSM